MSTYGKGEWRMRNGGKAVVEHDDGGNWLPLKGTIDGGVTKLWHRNGRYIFDEHEFDLVAPWEEPAPDPIDTEMQAWLKEVEAGMEGTTPGYWKTLIDDTGDQWSGWPLSIHCPSITDKTIVRPGGFYPYEWDAKTSQHEACQNANHIANTNPKRMAELIEFLKRRGVI